MLESDLHGNWVRSSMLNAQRWRKRDWRTCLMKPLLLLSSPRSRKSPKSAPYCKRSGSKDNVTHFSLYRGYYIYTHTTFFLWPNWLTDYVFYQDIIPFFFSPSSYQLLPILGFIFFYFFYLSLSFYNLDSNKNFSSNNKKRNDRSNNSSTMMMEKQGLLCACTIHQGMHPFIFDNA